MKPLCAIVTQVLLLIVTPVHSEELYSIKEVSIPSDENRQQVILGVQEFRCSYTLTDRPAYAQVIVESFRWGRHDKFYRGAHASNVPTATGVISLAWIGKAREMVTVIDIADSSESHQRAFLTRLFATRHLIDPGDFDEPSDCWFFKKREVKDGMIPLFGVCSKRAMQMNAKETPEEFVSACNEAGAHFSWVVYLHIYREHDENAVLPFDK